MEDDGACPSCGLPLAETTDEDYPYAYDAATVTCIACEERHAHTKEAAGDDGRLPPGMFVTVYESDERVAQNDE